MNPKVINLGLPKSGTTKLARALKLSGLNTVEHRIRKDQTGNKALQGSFVGDALYRGYFQTGDPWAFLSDFDAASEISCLREGHSLWPQMDFGLITALRKRHRGLRFVATWRDPEEIAEAMLAWSDLGSGGLPYSDIPGLPRGYGDTIKERALWITAHYDHLDALFASDPNYLKLDVGAPDATQLLSDHIGHRVTWWGRSRARLATFQSGRVA